MSTAQNETTMANAGSETEAFHEEKLKRPPMGRDERGESLVPSTVPPTIELGSLTKDQSSERPPGATMDQSGNEGRRNEDPLPSSEASAILDDDDTRPTVGRRKSTPRQNRPRLGDNPSGPYSYTFDPMTSESDSSTDDEAEDQRPDKQERPVRVDSDAFALNKKRRKLARQGQSYSRYAVGNEHFRSKGRFSKRDGRLHISINETVNSGYIAKALGQSLKHHLAVPKRRKKDEHRRQEHDDVDEDAKSIASSLRTKRTTPHLNIVIMVIGSRGDIQPFLKVGKILKEQHGHRVRIASHPTFRDFVQKENGLEFFSIGGDPAELMAFMVKNPGLVPNLATIREGEIQRRRTAMATMFDGFWRACINATDDEENSENVRMMDEKTPFVADCIIANPPSMAHVHIAERLGIPLHMMFTFPYTPTQQFPHPLANIKPQKSNVDANYVNFMSFGLVEMMTWQGLGDIVNRFREHTLGLEPVSSLWAPGSLYRMKVPHTYLWSPSLIPKPKDWGPEIDLAGFVFLDLASNFKPPKDLQDFLSAGEPPLYVGFGSIVVDDPNALTDMIFEATKAAGVRVLINQGWGGFGRSNEDTPDHVFMLGNTPHDWLFPKVKAVVHHGGAGTTAIGLKCAKPTMIVPFFGDQPFWGAMVAAAQAGAHECIPYKNMTLEKFTEGIKQCLTAEAQQNVQKIADSISKEGDGAENAVKSFHRSLPLAGRHNMRCSILEERAAVWQLRQSSLRLSPLAAQLLYEQGKVKWSELKLLRHYAWNDFDGPGEPITGTVHAVKDGLYGFGEGVGMVPLRIAKHVHQREAHERKKKQHLRRRAERQQHKDAARANASDANDDSAATDNVQRRRPVRTRTASTMSSAVSVDPPEPLAREIAGDLGSGVKRAGGALLTFPNDLLVALAQGFHNAPRLWGDVTVRKPVRITGFKSGCVAARDEFAYGIRDGWSGLVMHPVGEWKDSDTMSGKLAGLGIGLGKGLGGFVLKNINAAVAPPAYFGKGIVRYVEKRAEGPGSKNFIRRAQALRGQLERAELAQQSDGANEEALNAMRDRVNEGWSVYEELWREAEQIGGRRLRKEKRSWDANGALENVQTAKRALAAHKEGKDIPKLFAKRREEMREAERPRAGAMEHPDPHGDALPNGRGTLAVTDLPEDEPSGESESQQALDLQSEKQYSQPAESVDEEDGESGRTMVGSDDGGNKLDGETRKVPSLGSGNVRVPPESVATGPQAIST